MPPLDVQIDHPSSAHETIAWDALAVGIASVVRSNDCTLHAEMVAFMTVQRSYSRVTCHQREVWWRR